MQPGHGTLKIAHQIRKGRVQGVQPRHHHIIEARSGLCRQHLPRHFPQSAADAVAYDGIANLLRDRQANPGFALVLAVTPLQKEARDTGTFCLCRG